MSGPSVRRCVVFLVLLGAFLTVRGYRSRETDQAYRLPLLFHQQDPRLYADDPFVRAFDAFNPHRGYLALLDLAGRPFGLSVALAGLFGLTFLATCAGVERFGRAVWPDRAEGVGLVAASLVFLAQAGNVGTNHLFEPILIERLIAFALGWLAMSVGVAAPRSSPWAAPAVGVAALVHPSVGLQLAMLLSAGWLAWAALGGTTGVSWRGAALACGVLLASVVPGFVLNVGPSGRIGEGLAPEEFRLLCAELQSPQHMLPHLWRRPQWLAWGCYPLLALLALIPLADDPRPTLPPARRRLVLLIGVNLAGLAAAWFGIEVLQNLPITLVQPFRMATVARGLCLVLVAGHVSGLWARGGTTDRVRAVLIGTGLVGDWSLVVVTLFETTAMACERIKVGRLAGWVVLAAGLVFLARHDTESGHVPLLAAALATVGLGSWVASRSWSMSPGRAAARLAVAWSLPLAALGANLAPPGAWPEALVRRCRFAEVPIDDLERLALWCRDRTPADARFIGPPGPKTFRLWSLRSLAFNRAGSPYHAAGVADWAERFRDHVGFQGSTAAFVRAYLKDRHALERRYDAMTADELAALAVRQGASYVVARAVEDRPPLERLHTEGRYAVYRVSDLSPTPNPQPPTPISWSPGRPRRERDNPERTSGSRPERGR